jgi:hypothetical protein
LLSLSPSPAFFPWGMPAALAPDDDDDVAGADDEVAGAGVDDDVAAGVDVLGAADALLEAEELEFEPQPATTSAPRTRAPARSRRIDLPVVAMSIVVPFASGQKSNLDNKDVGRPKFLPDQATGGACGRV